MEMGGLLLYVAIITNTPVDNSPAIDKHAKYSELKGFLFRYLYGMLTWDFFPSKDITFMLTNSAIGRLNSANHLNHQGFKTFFRYSSALAESFGDCSVEKCCANI